MGNCFKPGVQSAHSSHHASRWSPLSLQYLRPSKISSKSSLNSLPSTQTFSIPSTLTAPSDGESGSLEVLRTSITEGEILSSSNAKAFTFGALKSATRNFRPDGLLGEGGFGCVYKGWIDEHTLAPSKPGTGMMVAIKKLKPEGFQGHKEWLTEVEYLGRLHHPNLVKLIGYCSDGDNRLLVYEYMAKGSLDYHLFRGSLQTLSWDIRIKVAIGAARGFAFLHEGESQVIFRDVKASNILVDSDFNGKLSDFGLVKVGPTGENTHVSTQVIGTHGYAAPEYIATGRLSAKADVYGFGALLLELLSGRRVLDRNRPCEEQSLVDWARPLLKDKRNLLKIMDSRLKGEYPKEGASTVATLALRCISINPKLRPNMSEVSVTLEQLQVSKKTMKEI